LCRYAMARAKLAKLKEAGADEEEVAAAAAVVEVADVAACEGTDEEELTAATKLQAVQRGRMARSKVANMKNGGTAEV
jgi:hypothetical protein